MQVNSCVFRPFSKKNLSCAGNFYFVNRPLSTLLQYLLNRNCHIKIFYRPGHHATQHIHVVLLSNALCHNLLDELHPGENGRVLEFIFNTGKVYRFAVKEV